MIKDSDNQQVHIHHHHHHHGSRLDRNYDFKSCPRGHWRPAEDEKLRLLVQQYGAQNWNSIAEKLQGRSGKSCRLRWFNQLDPRIIRKPFSEEEEERLLAAHRIHGNKWAFIARLFPGRTDNAVKNHWHVIMARKQREQSKLCGIKRSYHEYDHHRHFTCDDASTTATTTTTTIHERRSQNITLTQSSSSSSSTKISRFIDHKRPPNCSSSLFWDFRSSEGTTTTTTTNLHRHYLSNYSSKYATFRNPTTRFFLPNNTKNPFGIFESIGSVNNNNSKNAAGIVKKLDHQMEKLCPSTLVKFIANANTDHHHQIQELHDDQNESLKEKDIPSFIDFLGVGVSS